MNNLPNYWKFHQSSLESKGRTLDEDLKELLTSCFSREPSSRPNYETIK